MSNQDLIRAYKNTRTLINQNPNDKEKIINDYIDLVEKINDYYNNPNPYENQNTNQELGNMLKNPLEIAIYNNFQQYGTNTNTTATKNKMLNAKQSMNELAKLYAYRL